MKDKTLILTTHVIIWGVGLLAFIGWVMNIIAIVSHLRLSDEITAMFIARCVGVILAPFGSIIGWF